MAKNNFSQTEEQDILETPRNDGSVFEYFAASPMYAGFGNLNGQERDKFINDLGQLSVELKNFFTAKETAESIFEIGRSNVLIDGQISRLAQLIRDLVLGNIFIKDFTSILTERLDIDEPTAFKLVNRITSELLKPVIEDIKRIQRNKFAERINRHKPIEAAPPTPKPVQIKPPISQQSEGVNNNTKKALEDQLQKIASVIDLRNKSEN